MAATRRLLPLTLAYAVYTLATVPVSLSYDVGAHPGGRAVADMPLKGTGVSPPLFLPVLLVLGALLARRSHRRSAVAGAALDTLVGLAILGGSTVNVPNDLKAVRAAGAPTWITYASAGTSAVLALTIVIHAVAAVGSQVRRNTVPADATGG
jgi:hypothetical protein